MVESIQLLRNIGQFDAVATGAQLTNNTKTRYVIIYNGTYRDSGIINPLIGKAILYRASNMSEFRGDDVWNMEQYFPFNIHDDAFLFFKKKRSKSD